MDLNQAIRKHTEWRTTFRQAISGHETVNVETIAKDNCCELGKWLHGEAKSKFGKLPSYSECVTKHATFHIEAGKVAKAINAKRFAEAENMLNAGTEYAAASNAVGVAILHLQKDTGG